ncbi:mucin-5AC-like [Gouania willdenowi]|uniref:mucin-5AC-like n=1 Tax=Gouania willdenowi TaxID=441366 RepID=UPI001055B1C9|nr:mucin-5AC-like [Gouania willdenowi]
MLRLVLVAIAAILVSGLADIRICDRRIKEGCWTDWFDRDNPCGTGDWETLKHLHKENPGKICPQPSHIQAQTLSGQNAPAPGDNNVLISPSVGLICKNKDQKDKKCEDYRVRFRCSPPYCADVPGCWTDWFDRDNPSGSGDWELLKNLHKENPGKICPQPSQIQAQTLSGQNAPAPGDNNVLISPSVGLICKNKDQKDKKCEDYRVRFRCSPPYCADVPGCWTDWFDRDNPSGSGDWELLKNLHKENPGKICPQPSQIQAQTLSGQNAPAPGDNNVVISPTVGLICKNKDQKDKKCEDYRVRFRCSPPYCADVPGCWTDWFDRDNPSGSGDWELLKNLHKENPGKICPQPSQIQAQTLSGQNAPAPGDNNVLISQSVGLICKNKDQKDKKCEDYRVRFRCSPPYCADVPGCWTDWFDRDNPSGSGDWELLKNLHKENPGKICPQPSQIQAQTLSGQNAPAPGDNNVVISQSVGLICKNKDQKDKKCEDYRVRFRCSPPYCADVPGCWTDWFDRDNPSGSGDWELLKNLHKENPGKICPQPSQIQAQTLSGQNAPAPGDNNVLISPSVGLICKNKDQKDKKCEDYRVRFRCSPPYCADVPGCWTDWFDRDNPSGSGDWELLKNLHKENPGKICPQPSQIQAQTLSGQNAPAPGDNNVLISPNVGLICKNKDQKDKKCEDYRVRFRCPPPYCADVPGCWTDWFDRDNPSGSGDWELLKNLHKENPGKICPQPSQIQAQTLSGQNAPAPGDNNVLISPSVGLICKNKDQKDKKCEDYRVRFRCPPPYCADVPGCWTDWFDRDNPSGSGDWELLKNLHKENPGKICPQPSQIQAQTLSGQNAPAPGDNNVLISQSVGLICKNKDQKDKKCEDYRVRFRCSPPYCADVPGCWTDWFDRDNPSGSGDWELLKNLHKENPGKICPQPSQIQAQTLSGQNAPAPGDNNVVISPSVGLICKNKDQKDKKCEDYRVRFHCPPPYCADVPGCWTDWFDRDNPSGSGDWELLKNLHKENHGKICPQPSQIQAQTLSGQNAPAPGDNNVLISPSVGLICKNKDQKDKKCEDYRVRFRCSPPYCADVPGCWTDWFDRDNPSGSGDWELLKNLHKENPGKICPQPSQIQAQTLSGQNVPAPGDEDVLISPSVGLICKNKDQKDKKCEDYRVRFRCSPPYCADVPGCWTDWFDRDNPSGSGDWELLKNLHKENPGKICPQPSQIQAQTLSGQNAPAPGDNNVLISPSVGLICKNKDQKDKKCEDYRVRFRCSPPYCAVCWTKWFDQDDPSGTGDWELLKDLRNENPGQICEKPLAMEVVTAGNPTIAAINTGQIFNINNPHKGFVCLNKEQKPGGCFDYKVRFACPCIS